MSEIDSPILTITDISFKLGSVILVEIRDIKNFRSPSQLLAYAGAESSVSTSGINQIETGRMVKWGSSQLRWAVHGPVKLMSIWSSMRVYFQKKLAEVNHFNVTISHIVRKLVRIIYNYRKIINLMSSRKWLLTDHLKNFLCLRFLCHTFKSFPNYAIQTFHFVLDVFLMISLYKK